MFTVFERRQRFLWARRDWVPKKDLKKKIDRTAGALAKLKHMSARFSRFEDEGRFYSNQRQERVKTMIGDEDRGVADSIIGRPPRPGCPAKTKASSGLPNLAPPPSLGASPSKRDPDSYAHTDLGNAERLLDEHGSDLRFTDAAGVLWWDGKTWLMRSDSRASGMAIKTVRAMLVEAKKLDREHPDRAKALLSFARQSERYSCFRSMLAVAKGLATNRGLFVPELAKVFDTHEFLLNVSNGIIDLHTGDLYPHQRLAYLTKCSPVRFNPSAECPRFLSFMERIFGGNAELIGFIQRSFGYALTGSVAEQCLWFFYGKGDNEKSTLVNAISSVLGDYSTSTSIDMLLLKRRTTITNYIARLRGARVVTVKENNDGRQLSEATVKKLTGGDVMTARFLRKEWFDFKPTFKLIIAGNHKPRIRGTEDGIRRRMRFADFNVTIPKNERDGDLLEKLKGEREGILAWLVRGCLQWQKHGLAAPASGARSTRKYREGMEAVEQWVGECCLQSDNESEAGGMLSRSYQTFCRGNGLSPLNGGKFADGLRERGFVRVRGSKNSIWKGLGLTDEARSRVQAADDPRWGGKQW